MPDSNVVNQGQVHPRPSVAIVGTSQVCNSKQTRESDGVDVQWYRGP